MDKNFEELEEKIKNRQKRSTSLRKTQKISGRSVFKLQEIIEKKAKKDQPKSSDQS